MELVDVTQAVIGAAIEVHRALGPGLLESAYSRCLKRELELSCVRFESEVDVPVSYKGVQLAAGYRLDLLVERTLVVEIKAVDRLLGVHESQVLTYLRLTGHRVGLLINFHVPVLRHGLRRLTLPKPAPNHDPPNL
jgi:GxxExxY protein